MHLFVFCKTMNFFDEVLLLLVIAQRDYYLEELWQHSRKASSLCSVLAYMILPVPGLNWALFFYLQAGKQARPLDLPSARYYFPGGILALSPGPYYFLL